MGREHKPETVWRAQELYCVDRLSFARVAEIVGTSPTTLKAWARKFHWAAKREEIARAESEIRVNIIRSRKAALEQLLAASEPKEAAPMGLCRRQSGKPPRSSGRSWRRRGRFRA